MHTENSEADTTTWRPRTSSPYLTPYCPDIVVGLFHNLHVVACQHFHLQILCFRYLTTHVPVCCVRMWIENLSKLFTNTFITNFSSFTNFTTEHSEQGSTCHGSRVDDTSVRTIRVVLCAVTEQVTDKCYSWERPLRGMCWQGSLPVDTRGLGRLCHRLLPPSMHSHTWAVSSVLVFIPISVK